MILSRIRWWQSHNLRLKRRSLLISTMLLIWKSTTKLSMIKTISARSIESISCKLTKLWCSVDIWRMLTQRFWHRKEHFYRREKHAKTRKLLFSILMRLSFIAMNLLIFLVMSSFLSNSHTEKSSRLVSILDLTFMNASRSLLLTMRS